ncbi:MAG: carboxypeptidase-like regulatory domain-containing protein [Gammaproteobacteria bacterium]|nr:carboxypeptidase-like regulatory domain-containing protein [Gammaproteobacteria bacterium]
MAIRHIIGPLLLTLLLGLLLYLLVAQQLPPAPPNTTSDRPPAPPAVTSSAVSDQAAIKPASAIARAIPGEVPAAQTPGRKTLEIHGRIVDRDGRPLESVVVAEERYHQRTHSDSDGRYRLRLEFPRHRYPVLHFLRSGYAGARIELGQRELDPAATFRLDVELVDALDSVTLAGWVSDQNGIGIGDARVELSVADAPDQESFYLTDFTDARGNFSFEGVRAGQAYALVVDHTPHHPRYRDSALVVGPDPAPLHIELPALRFVDVEGMLLTRDALPVSNYEIHVTNLTTGTHKSTIVSDSSGYFRLQQFPTGEIDLSTRGPELYRITGLRIDADNYQNLVLTIDRGDYYLSGWVSDENGIALENAMVTVDREFSQGSLQYQSYRSGGTDRDGAFAFDNLGGGEHRVTAYAWGYEKQETSLRFDSPARTLHFRLRPSP